MSPGRWRWQLAVRAFRVEPGVRRVYTALATIGVGLPGVHAVWCRGLYSLICRSWSRPRLWRTGCGAPSSMPRLPRSVKRRPDPPLAPIATHDDPPPSLPSIGAPMSVRLRLDGADAGSWEVVGIGSSVGGGCDVSGSVGGGVSDWVGTDVAGAGLGLVVELGRLGRQGR